jgi:hypothetical protein
MPATLVIGGDPGVVDLLVLVLVVLLVVFLARRV